MSNNKTLGAEGLGELIDILKNELANAGSSVPTITIVANQVVSADLMNERAVVELTTEQQAIFSTEKIIYFDFDISTGYSVYSGVGLQIDGVDGYIIAFENHSTFAATALTISHNTPTEVIISVDYNFPKVKLTQDDISQSGFTIDAIRWDKLYSNSIVIVDTSDLGIPSVLIYKQDTYEDDDTTILYYSSPMGSFWRYAQFVITKTSDGDEYAYAVSLNNWEAIAGANNWNPSDSDEVITPGFVKDIFAANYASATSITSASTLPDDIIRDYITYHLPIRINGALCHYMDENTTTNIVRYFTATMNGALVHLNIIEINTSTWVVTFNQVDVGASPNVDQDLTANTCFTLNATAFASLVSTHTATVASPIFTGLSNTYEFVTIKASINGANYNVKLCRNDTNKYSGLFFIEDSSHLYELTLYYNGTNVYLRCATVY